MSLSLVTPPVSDVITIDEAKTHLRVTDATEDASITTLIKTAQGFLDGEYGILGRALVTQTWDLFLKAFPSTGKSIQIPLQPLQSITSVKYVNPDGNLITLDASKYIVDTAENPPLIHAAYGETWPDTRDQPNAVTIRFVAGYGAAAAVPEPIKAAMRLLIGHWYQNREPVNIGNITTPLPKMDDALLSAYRKTVF